MLKKYRSLFLPVLLIHCITSAQTPAVDSMLGLLNKASEDTGKVNLYYSISRTLRFTDPARAMEYGQQGVSLAKKLQFDNGTAGCYMNISTAYIYSDKLDTALLYLDTALQYAHKANDPNRLGLAYLNRADIYRQMQNISQSLKDCETALSYADKANNDDVRARVNQTFGSIYSLHGNYPQSISYNNKAIALYDKIGNARMSASVLNNLGIVYKVIKDFPKAVDVTARAIRITDSLHDITNLSVFNGNLADVYYEMGKYDQANIYAGKAMEYAVMQNNEYQVAVSGVFQGMILVKRKQYREGIDLLNSALDFFKADGDIARVNTTADVLAEAYASTGDYQKAFTYMKLSRSATDTIVKQQYDEDIAAMQTKFSVKEKDQEIQLLAKDKELQQQKLRQQSILMIAAVVIALLALAGIWLAVNRYRLRQRMKELELRNQIAADLHDEVGSSLSSIHMLSQMATQQENNAELHKNILAKMSSNARETMDKMGDIVWMIKPGETEAGNLKQRMERFAYEIGSTKNVVVSVNADDLEKIQLTMAQRKNIYLIFKEAMNNAVKYSGSAKIDIIGSVQNKEITLTIKDEGRGFDSAMAAKGNGLDNMQNRAKELGGDLTITSVLGQGTVIKLAVPV